MGTNAVNCNNHQTQKDCIKPSSRPGDATAAGLAVDVEEVAAAPDPAPAEAVPAVEVDSDTGIVTTPGKQQVSGSKADKLSPGKRSWRRQVAVPTQEFDDKVLSLTSRFVETQAQANPVATATSDTGEEV